MLLDEAQKVFPIYPVPGEILLNAGDSSEFSFEIMNRFHGKSWDALVIDDWVNIGVVDTLKSYMSAKAFHYYLPSILLLSIAHEDYVDWGLKSIVPSNQLNKPKGVWWEDYFACFSGEQKRFIQNYIINVLDKVPAYSAEEHLAQVALEDIWQ